MSDILTNEDKNDIWSKVDFPGVWEAFLSIKDEKELKAFFRDLMTEKEIAEFNMRWTVANMLDRGVTFAEIEQKMGISPITITRINKWLREGCGGYRMMIDRLAKKR